MTDSTTNTRLNRAGIPEDFNPLETGDCESAMSHWLRPGQIDFGPIGKDTCRPCSGSLSTETSNSTLHPPVLTSTCSDAGGLFVEVAKPAVSNLKALELKPARRHAHHGGILAPGGRRWEPARVAVAGETRCSPGVGDVRCRRASRGSGDPDDLRHGSYVDPFRTSVIVPAPHVPVRERSDADGGVTADGVNGFG